MTVMGKAVLIPGAAGGLGNVIARRFAEAGANVALADRDPDRLTKMCGGLIAEFGALTIPNIDVTDPESVGLMVAQTLDKWGRLDVLLNLVGGYRAGDPVHKTKVSDWDFLMQLNAKSVFLVAGAAAAQMIKQGQGGRIVSISALPALKGSANQAAYSASKSAVVRITEAMAAELKDYLINVNCVLPGIIDTPANREALPNADFEKWVKPSTIADVLLFLAGEQSTAVNGAAIPLTAYA